MSRRLVFQVEVEVEDVDGQKTEAPTERTLQDWMEDAPMAWSAEGINATFVYVTKEFDDADEEIG